MGGKLSGENEGKKKRPKRFRAMVEEGSGLAREEMPRYPSKPLGYERRSSEMAPLEISTAGEGTVDMPATQTVPKTQAPPAKHPRFGDRLLLLVELAALLGLLFVVVSSFESLRRLNLETVQAWQRRATEEAGVLPGSSSPPQEAPGYFPPFITKPTSTPLPTPSPKQPTRIVIPAIAVDAPVVEGDSWEELRMGAGHRIDSANPGENGNMVISGHDDIFGEVFKRIGELEAGDEVTVYAGSIPYRYTVTERKIVKPTDLSVLDPTPEARLTLITCYPYLIDTHRLVVIAELENQ